MSRPPIVVMGVSAVGKTSVGQEIARLTSRALIDADDLHSAANVAKMRSGAPLTDHDRQPWLDRVGAALGPDVVMACSALKRVYRDVMRAHAPDVVFVHLDADGERLTAQADARVGHFMPPALLQSQLDLLERLGDDEAGVVIDVDDHPPALAQRALDATQYARQAGAQGLSRSST